MADKGVWVETVEAVLRSEIGMSSAQMMKVEYLPEFIKNKVADQGAPVSQSVNTLPDQELPGPNALISITKISTPTPHEEIKNLLKNNPDREEILHNYDFYTILLCTSITMGDPSTTRFINATVEFVFPAEVKILDYSPKERGIVTGIIIGRGSVISLSPTLDFSASLSKSPEVQSDNSENRFEFMAGPDTKITGTFSKKSGYSLFIPPGELLEYMVMLKNEHDIYGEIYPPMPTQEIESTGKENLAVFSVIIKTPKNLLPEIYVNIEGRVKGILWGVISLKGRVVFTKSGSGS